jgi:hypothetical protein
MHFDTYFKTYISSRKDLLLSDDMTEDDTLPKNTILKILKVMQIVLENCQNKSSFSGLEVSFLFLLCYHFLMFQIWEFKAHVNLLFFFLISILSLFWHPQTLR